MNGCPPDVMRFALAFVRVDRDWNRLRTAIVKGGEPDSTADLLAVSAARLQQALNGKKSGRPPNDAAALTRRQVELRDLVVPVAMKLWSDVEGGPTLELVAENVWYTAKGLESALRRAGLRWGDLKELARQSNFRRFVKGA
jgi:hypothetical protein